MENIEHILEEINNRREIHVSNFQRISTSISKFQLIRALIIAVLVFLVVNQDFHPPEYKNKRKVLNEWEKKYASHPSIKKILYSYFIDIKLKENQRLKLTTIVEDSKLVDKIDPGMHMEDVLKFLINEEYGLNPLKLHDLDDDVGKLMSLANRIGFLKELPAESKESFFQNTLASHPYLENEFPYDPNKNAMTFLKNIESIIMQAHEKFKKEFLAWEEYKDQLYKYNWYTWKNLSDDAIYDWHNKVLPIVGDIDTTTLSKIGDGLRIADLGSVINYIKNKLTAEEEQYSKRKEKATFWSIELDIPIHLLLIFSPLIYFGSRAILRSLQLRRSVSMIIVAKLDQLLDSLLKTRLSGSIANKQCIDQEPKYTFPFLMDYNKLFDRYPTFFPDLFYGLFTFVLSIYLFMKIVIVLTDDNSILFHSDYWFVVIVITIIGILIDYLSYRISSKIIAEKRAEEMVVGIEAPTSG